MQPIVDSNFSSLEAAVSGSIAPEEVLQNLALITVQYISFDGLLHEGQLVVHKELVEDVRMIFSEILTIPFPVLKCVPIVAYSWDDDASMADNNSSAFNYRHIVAKEALSNHSFGRAIDINPLQNPYFAASGTVYPPITYDPSAKGALNNASPAVQIFKNYGWEWLGERVQNPDYQHFQKLS